MIVCIGWSVLVNTSILYLLDVGHFEFLKNRKKIVKECLNRRKMDLLITGLINFCNSRLLCTRRGALCFPVLHLTCIGNTELLITIFWRKPTCFYAVVTLFLLNVVSGMMGRGYEERHLIGQQARILRLPWREESQEMAPKGPYATTWPHGVAVYKRCLLSWLMYRPVIAWPCWWSNYPVPMQPC